MGSIQVVQVGKAYKQYPTRWSPLLEWLMPWAGTRHQLRWVLKDVSFHVRPGEALGVIGINGAGKSTLLNIIGLLDTPSSGELYLLGQPTRDSDDATRTALRNQAIGFVFQFHHLISAFSVLENVLMPLMIRRSSLRCAPD